MIRFLLLSLFVCFSSSSLFAQESSKELRFSNWEKFDESAISATQEWIEEHKELLGLSPSDKLVLVKEYRDALGIHHFKYQQYYHDYKVEGAEYLLHGTDKEMWGNGRLVHDLNPETQLNLSEEQALSSALDYFDAEKYYWEDPYHEALLKKTTQDPNASYFPSGELVLADPNYEQAGANYKLLWKFEIYGFNEKMCEFVFVDASSGEIAYTLSGVHTDEVEGTASTRYYGEQSIITDSISSDLYHLVDSSRGGGIITYNLQESEELEDAVHFEDADNYWDNANAAMDDAATDLHWGVEMTYDYFFTQHGRNSFDGNGSPLITYAHYGANYLNAAWVGTYGYFGDGDDNPWTSIDIVGHEVAHGVTKYSASLIYFYESGALNESFSDIFGTTIEHFAIPDSANWVNGVLNFIIRDMSDPNAFGDPDTYLGDFWQSGSADFGGVHSNSGVQNFWYYLLVEGGTGVNDNDDSYDVEGLGFEVAGAIAYRNLTTYLTATSNYADARQGAIQSAIDLYGSCSNEVQQVINAWHAVGLGSDTYTADLQMEAIVSPSNDCNLSNEESVSVLIKLNESGCNTIISAGSEIAFSYQLDENELVSDTLVLTNDFNVGDMITFTFDQTISLPEIAEEYELDVYVNYVEDDFLNNNSIIDAKIERKYDHGNVNMGFENLGSSLDSFYVQTGDHSQVRISSSAENTGNRGLMMTAKNTSGYLSDFAEDPENNFEQNPEYISRACFCVDAQDWENVRVKFDMKQTFSKLYFNNWGSDSAEYASSLRLMVNGYQSGDQFHPTTNIDDEYLTYVYDLDSLAGEYFEFCFESKNYLSTYNDNIDDSQGDNTYLDNVLFYDPGVNSIDEKELNGVNLYPNPSDGIVFIELAKTEQGMLEVVDMQGRIVFSEEWKNKKEGFVDLSDLVTGLYTLFIYTESQRYVAKVQID